MTPITHITDNVLSVRVPEGAYNFMIGIGVDNLQCLAFEKENQIRQNKYDWITLSSGQYELIGRASELNELQWIQIVEQSRMTNLYKDYEKAGNSVGKFGSFFLDTATESGHSLLQSKGIYLKNPYPEPDKKSFAYGNGHHYNVSLYNEAKNIWQEAQEKVCDPVLIRKVK